MKLHGLVTIGNDPELRYSQSGLAMLQLSLAYKFGKEKQTQWVKGSLFGKRAESLAPYLAKGQLIYAEVSDVNVAVYTKKDGSQGVSLEGIIQDVGLTSKADKPATQPAPAKPVQDLADIDLDIPF